jgi:hypothetical protein
MAVIPKSKKKSQAKYYEYLRVPVSPILRLALEEIKQEFPLFDDTQAIQTVLSRGLRSSSKQPVNQPKKANGKAIVAAAKKIDLKTNGQKLYKKSYKELYHKLLDEESGL